MEMFCVQAALVSTQSSSRGEQLAKRLKDAGAKMYGAFWCSHCHEQKEAFGSQAMKDFPYVECYPDGFHKVRCISGHTYSIRQVLTLDYKVQIFCRSATQSNSEMVGCRLYLKNCFFRECMNYAALGMLHLN